MSRFLKLYAQDGKFFASCLHAEDAALIATNYPGCTIRDGHQKKRTLWTEGAQELTGGESADMVARIIYDRRDAKAESHSPGTQPHQFADHTTT